LVAIGDLGISTFAHTQSPHAQIADEPTAHLHGCRWVAGARFAVGDCIVGTWAGTPLGGMAEYALLDVELTAPKPAGLSPAEAAALPNSSLHALDALREAEVRPGERVLVLGGGGGVGTALLQLLKNEANAGFVATTASAPQAELLASLGADRVIDYTKEAWSESPEFVSNPFDVVIDCAEGLSGWEAAKRSRGVKRGGEGGRFIAVSSDDPHMQIHNAAQLAAFSATTLLREPASRVRAADWPRYHMYLGGATPASLAEVCALAEAGRLRVVLDPAGPFPFTTEGLRAAYNLQASFHAHGKVVVEIEPQG